MKIIVKQRPVGHVSVTAKAPARVAVNQSPVVIQPIPPTPEQVQAAVDIFLIENPVQLTPEQVQEAIDAYLITNPIELTPQQIQTAIDNYLTDNPDDIQAAIDAYLADNPPQLSPTQVQAAVDAYLAVNPVVPTQGQVSVGVAAYLVDHPVDPIPPTPEQVQVAVDEFLTLHPVEPIAPTPAQVQVAVDNFLIANPVQVPPMQLATAVADGIEAYFAGDGALRESMKGANNGVATLDASGGLVQRMKIATGSTPIAIRDSQGVGNGKASSFVASIAVEASSVILMKTGVWQSNLDYVARLFGSCADGIVDVTVALLTSSGSQVVQAINRGNVPVAVTFGRYADGYSGWAFERAWGRCQIVVTECAVVGNGTGDNQVRGWLMDGANDKSALTQQVPVTVT